MPQRLLLTLATLVAVNLAMANPLPTPVIVSAYQGPSHQHDAAANLQIARNVIAQALARGSRFLVFPERFLSGPASPNAPLSSARSPDDPALQAFIADSTAHDLVVVLGLVRQSGAQRFNSALVLHRGHVLGWHDKILLTPSERADQRLVAGTQVPVFEAHGIRFATPVGADAAHLPIGLAARLQGARLLLTPHADTRSPEPAGGLDRRIRSTHPGLATHLNVAIARASTPATDSPNAPTHSDTFILSPQGSPLAEANPTQTTLLHATLTPDLFHPPIPSAAWEATPTWLRDQLGDLFQSHRRPRDDADLRSWLVNMRLLHNYTDHEIAAATGMPLDEIAASLHSLTDAAATLAPPSPGEPIRVAPYPGGRHPRRGFFDGAVAPQRETKISVFPPWKDGGYVVVDVPEAIFSNLGLTYLAHTHIPTLWDRQGITLERREWEPDGSGGWSAERTLPNRIAFGTRVSPRPDGVRMELWLRNGTAEPLTGLRVQNCVMLGHATGFGEQTLTNKVFDPPFAAVKSPDGNRWILTAWQRCGRAWGNVLVPCLHSDPVFPDCPPGATVRLQGWLSFYEGPDPEPEFLRLLKAGILNAEPDSP
ncbi:MAG: carbon-nitrogen hydrolase family protein [Verrucomicrobiae bacterium]|nr:carbon-nitrogen hydrolase family protein [Verrucomicrobiae bacterium]